MASYVYNRAKQQIAAGTMNLDTDLLKVLLVTAEAGSVDSDFVSTVATSEAVPTNYTRKTANIYNVAESDASDRAEVLISDITWTSLGGAVNSTIVGAILYKSEGAGDAASTVICFWDITDTPTNGGDFTLQMSNDGNIRLA
jgi:hypothetical protein